MDMAVITRNIMAKTNNNQRHAADWGCACSYGGELVRAVSVGYKFKQSLTVATVLSKCLRSLFSCFGLQG